jgi:hypothetical protein
VVSAKVVASIEAGTSTATRNEQSLCSVAALDDFDVVDRGAISIGTTLLRIPRVSHVIERQGRDE